jgi:hypothetical protein
MLAQPVRLGRQLRPAAPVCRAGAVRCAAVAAPRGVRCAAPAAAEQRLPPSQVRKVTFEGAAAGEATLALKTAKESTAVGLVHRYLVLVRQNARRVRLLACAWGF